ncbi:unnamed protein product [Urochloa decumbens]|uniref:Uncharacterized protein n=1 Tax=Urochloa decumbens TaxID=240449 RepID=A0ABC8W2F4_9POAL
MVVKKLGVALVVALALLALMEPAAAGVKFADEDVESEEALWRLYERWLAHFNVSRHPAEKLRRFSLFKEAARQIHRRAAVRGRVPGLNRFVDVSATEFNSDYGCNDKPDEPADARLHVTRRGDGSLPLPVSIDWRDKTCGTGGGPCLPTVKSQRGCGSCWAFAAVGAVESHYAIQGARDNRGILDLSEQELVDCDNNGHGCKGGSRTYALDYIAKKGISSEADYPYTATNGTCQAAGKPRVDLIVRGYETVRPYDEFDLLTAVGYGPVAVAISVGKQNNHFQYYEDGDGIYDGPCTRETRHSILLVGYTANSYILKNSYGEDWGYQGYMYLKRGPGNGVGTCDILVVAGAYPKMA